MASAATIAPAEVERAVTAQLGAGATVGTWRVDALGRGRGDAATSLGVCRISGSARVGDSQVGWSQIRKAFLPPPDVAGLDMGRTPGHWNYWRREPTVMASDLLIDLPGGVAAPRPYLVEGTADAATVWMEDLGSVGGAGWNRTDLHRAAHRLGRLGGRYAGRVPDVPWLSRDLLGQWVRDLPAFAAPLLSDGAPGWSHPAARDVFPAGPTGPVARLLANAATALPSPDAGRMTLCHRDTGLDNLLLRGADSELVLFDWALAGAGPIGEDLGVMIASVARLPMAGPDPLSTCRELVEHYLAGVELEFDPAAVWRTAVVTAALREAIFAAFHIARGIESPGASEAIRAALRENAGVIEAFAAEALARAATTQPERDRS